MVHEIVRGINGAYGTISWTFVSPLLSRSELYCIHQKVYIIPVLTKEVEKLNFIIYLVEVAKIEKVL